jgi:dTDP-4-dehydrorhamnose reductase
MRLLVTGWQGQVARGFVEAAPARADIVACAIGRPALDLCEPGTIEQALTDVRPDIVINTAAYTAVDKAESEPARAFALNRDGAGMLAAAAARRGIPIIHLSTDYVYDGLKPGPYVETDEPGPRSVYGHSKLDGERAVQAANPKHIILRTAWVFSPVGQNFVKTMLRLAGERDRVRVVGDQQGSPTYAPHLVAAILDVAAQVTNGDGEDRWGVYHAAGAGTASWYDVACEVFKRSAARNGPAIPVDPITTADYPTAAARPANSRLDCSKLQRNFGVALPEWQSGVEACVGRLLS